jgi:uncharacterized Zn finger protein (UPF0148 family)
MKCQSCGYTSETLLTREDGNCCPICKSRIWQTSKDAHANPIQKALYQAQLKEKKQPRTIQMQKQVGIAMFRWNEDADLLNQMIGTKDDSDAIFGIREVEDEGPNFETRYEFLN